MTDRIIDQIDEVLADDDPEWEGGEDAASWSPADGWNAPPDDEHDWDDTDLIDMTTPPAPIVQGRRPRHAPIITLSGECAGAPLLWVQPSGMGVGPAFGYWAGSVELVAAATVMRDGLTDPNDTRALAYIVTRLCDETDDATSVLGLDYEMRNGR